MKKILIIIGILFLFLPNVMADRYVSFKSNGDLFQFGSLRKSLAEIKTIKEVGGVTVFSITANELKQLQDGCDASESGGVVTIGVPINGLDFYKTERKGEQKAIARELFKAYRDDIANSDTNVSSYKTNLKDYFIANVQSVGTSTTKAEVDQVIANVDWSSVTAP